ncbi:extracellular solute-binding protein [Paenibacillaceae bacterium]|nr:extracellular solute-binding protein [Paenibacillaceae bacterium]
MGYLCKNLRPNVLILRITMLALVSSLLVSCSGTAKEKEPVTLRVMATDEYSFHASPSTADFAAQFTDITLEPAIFDDRFAASYAETEKAIAQLMPDVIRVPPGLYRKLAEEGKLVDLDALIRKDHYPIDKMVPSLIDYTRAQGDGRLYGIPGWFNSKALYYNKDLFNRYQIPYPEDQMTWEDVILLAQRFPEGEGEEESYGFHTSGYLYGEGVFILVMAETMDLSYLDTDGNQVTINNDEWRQLFETALSGIRSGKVVIQAELAPEKFVAGKAAMNVSYPFMAQKLDNPEYDQERLKDRVMFDWGIVTAPVNPKSPENGGWEVEMIYAINSNSANVEAAWEYIKFIKSEDRSSPGESIWAAQMQEIGGRSLEPFYKLPPKMHKREYPTVPGTFHEELPMIIQKHFAAIVGDEISVDDALNAIEEEAQLLLYQTKAEQQ